MQPVTSSIMKTRARLALAEVGPELYPDLEAIAALGDEDARWEAAVTFLLDNDYLPLGPSDLNDLAKFMRETQLGADDLQLALGAQAHA